MTASKGKEVQDKLKILKDFWKSDLEKIYLVIGAEEPSLYHFMEASIEQAIQDPQHRVFRYEIWPTEHSRHFLYRWLRDTVGGQAFVGPGPWSQAVEDEAALTKQLDMLIQQDIRPLEIRFLEAIRFFTKQLEGEQQVVLHIIPRTGLTDPVLIDFFNAMLRILPVQIKMLVGQHEDDVLAQKADFSPSNRLHLDPQPPADMSQLRDRCLTLRTDKGIEGRIVNLLSHVVHPLETGLLAQLLDQDEASVRKALAADDLKQWIEQTADNGWRLTYPRLVSAAAPAAGDFSVIDQKLADIYAQRLTDPADRHSATLYHSMALARQTDAQAIAAAALETTAAKENAGGADICEYELDRALNLLGDRQPSLRAELLLKLGAIRESRSRSHEALQALDPAIEELKALDQKDKLQQALELKGRACFAVREVDQAEAALEASLQLTREMKRPALTADVTSQIAYLHYASKKLDKAEKWYRNALHLYEAMTDDDPLTARPGIAGQWANLGHTMYAGADFQKAEEHHRKALEIYQELEDQKATANQWGFIGHTLFAAHQFDRSVEAYERAAQIEEAMGEHLKAAQRYANVGHSMYAQRKVDLAEKSFQKSLDKYRSMGEPAGEAAQLSNLGIVKGDQGEFEPAIDYFQQAARIYQGLNDTISEADQIVKQGHVHRAQKHYPEAIKRYEEALTRYQSIQYAAGEGNTELDLAQLFAEKEDWDEALKRFKHAKEIFAKVGNLEKEALCTVLIATAHHAHGQADAAIDTYHQAMEVYKKSENPLGVANVAAQLGLLHYERKNYHEAEQQYLDALATFREKEDQEGEANLLSNIGTLYYHTDRLDEAGEQFEKALELLRTMGHPLGIAGVLQNLSYVYEQQEKYGQTHDCLKEARDIFSQMRMTSEIEAIEQRMVGLDERAGNSLDRMRAELFPGLSGDDDNSSKKKGKQLKKTKIGRNDPCPCGSGKKYKFCCGA